MNFLNIGPSELMVILALAILAIGPKRMVEIARTLGRATSKLRKISGEFMAIIQAELRETEAGARELVDGTVAGEAGVQGEMKATGQQAKGTVASLKEEIGLASLQAELQATERATREFLEKAGQEEEEEAEDLAAPEEAPAEEAEPVAESTLPPDTTALEQVQREQATEKEQTAAAAGPAEESQETETRLPVEAQRATPGTALVLASSQGELAEQAGEGAPAIEAVGTEATAEEEAPETQPVLQAVDETRSERQKAISETPIATQPAPESEPEETEAETGENSEEQLAAPEPACETAGPPPVAVSEEAAALSVPAEEADIPEEPPLSPEEEARVQEAVARAAGLIGPEQTEAEKVDEDDRQE